MQSNICDISYIKLNESIVYLRKYIFLSSVIELVCSKKSSHYFVKYPNQNIGVTLFILYLKALKV